MRLFALVVLLLFPNVMQQSNPSAPTKDASIQKGDSQRERQDEQQQPHDEPSVLIQQCDRCSIIEKCIGCSGVEKPHTQAEQDQPYNARKDTLYRGYLWFTIAGVVGALIGISVIYLQTKATQEAARAASRSAKVAEDTLKITQRAYLSVDDWNVLNIATGMVPAITYKIFNSGPTPATLIESSVKYLISLDLPETPTYDLKPCPRNNIRGHGFTASRFEFKEPPTNETIESLNKGIQFIYVWGLIRYEDYFGEPHALGFSMKYDHLKQKSLIPPKPGYNYWD